MAQAILKTVFGALATSIAVVSTTAQMASAQGFTGSFAVDQWELFNSRPAFTGIDNSRIGIEQTEDGSIRPVLDGGTPLAPFNGSVDFTDAPDSLTLFGSDQASILNEFGYTCGTAPSSVLFVCDLSITTVFITVPEPTYISFSWDYSTPDLPVFDPFGFVVSDFPPTDPRADGVFNILSDPAGGATQSGSVEMFDLMVKADQVFGLQIGTDNRGGRAQVTIRDFQARPIISEPDEGDPTSVPEPTSGVAIAVMAGLGLSLRAKSRSRKQ